MDLFQSASKVRQIDNEVEDLTLKTSLLDIKPNTDSDKSDDLKARRKKVYKFEFELDDFQKKSIEHLQNDTNLLVSAPTSSGKTVVAIQAIYQCLQEGSRVFYTSPTKALSNQIFRDLHKNYFPYQIGLLTGDEKINTGAKCLVMTAEVLRNILFGNEVGKHDAKFVNCVVFDEAHYISEKERGEVWETSLILLEKTIKLVFLSATIKNAEIFLDWISKIKEKPCEHVTKTTRPIEITHFTLNEQNILGQVLESNKSFEKRNFEKNVSRTDFNMNEQIHINNLLSQITDLTRKGYSPLICFSFKRAKCETIARLLQRRWINSQDYLV